METPHSNHYLGKSSMSKHNVVNTALCSRSWHRSCSYAANQEKGKFKHPTLGATFLTVAWSLLALLADAVFVEMPDNSDICCLVTHAVAFLDTKLLLMVQVHVNKPCRQRALSFCLSAAFRRKTSKPTQFVFTDSPTCIRALQSPTSCTNEDDVVPESLRHPAAFIDLLCFGQDLTQQEVAVFYSQNCRCHTLIPPPPPSSSTSSSSSSSSPSSSSSS